MACAIILDIAIDDDLWRRLSTDKASCLNRNCYYYRECPFFVARREIQEAEVVVANHALVDGGDGKRSRIA
ncbi:ATP-dependent DNA helicase DinG [Escherichia coli]|nr:ATP-dependent DNA helicase DinG [Escherichia coli]